MQRVKGKVKDQIHGHMKRQNEGWPNFEFGTGENTPCALQTTQHPPDVWNWYLLKVPSPPYIIV